MINQDAQYSADVPTASTGNGTGTGPGNGSLRGGDHSTLPPQAEVHRVLFTAEPQPNQAVLLDLPVLGGFRAVIANETPETQTETPLRMATVLNVPVEAGQTEDPNLLAKARTWVDPDWSDCPAAAATATAERQIITLQGVKVFWSRSRIAILAPKNRLPLIEKAIIEGTFIEGELSEIERNLATWWPKLESDAPLAFEANERTLRHRKTLAKRFQEVIMLRAKLARLSPYVHCPHQHPPTLASQMGERLRERLRMEYREEFLSGQLEAFESVYEMCGQRMSDFVLTRSGNKLEWIIIVLLLVQIIIYGFEILVNTGS